MKNWSGRNEVTETSGRLHPLWPQNKWLHTPRTTDYRHTRQDRWIQMELASTLAKNATKPNPFEIIPLQTTRKEYNWKTEEALARAAVTVETERIRGSNLWCLWWLWWWLWWWYQIQQRNEFYKINKYDNSYFSVFLFSLFFLFNPLFLSPIFVFFTYYFLTTFFLLLFHVLLLFSKSHTCMSVALRMFQTAAMLPHITHVSICHRFGGRTIHCPR